MACNHPQAAWIGKADGIYCGQCGAKIEQSAPAKAAKTEPKQAEEKAPEPAPKKAAPKKGGKK